MQFEMQGRMAKKKCSAIMNLIHEFEKRHGKIRGSVKLLAVTKNQSVENIQTAIDEGQFSFGESYLQEALPKIEFFSSQKNLEWHFIGSIQANKTKKIAENFSWVQSVNSIQIAKRLHEQRPDFLPPLNICLQVNVSGEKTKSGIPLNEVVTLATECSSLSRIKLRGLMTVPAAKNNFDEQRTQLHPLKLMFDELNAAGFELDTLSMGMSDDMEAAIAEGATMVRIGTAIFGTRKK